MDISLNLCFPSLIIIGHMVAILTFMCLCFVLSLFILRVNVMVLDQSLTITELKTKALKLTVQNTISNINCAPQDNLV